MNRYDISKFEYCKDDMLKCYNNKGYQKYKEYCVISGISLISAMAYLVEEGLEPKAENDLQVMLSSYGYTGVKRGNV
jgi:hypothetical protein